MTNDLAKKLISDEELLPHLPHPISLAGKNLTRENLDALANLIRIDLAKKKLAEALGNQPKEGEPDE
tara:strand:- start:28428 stop:28628 length:201 start_codon:yes stop_codon:yes gene_type:complete